MFKAGFIVYWKANQAHITEAFCENKNKPQMCCNGKCYLNKQLKKADDTETDKRKLPNAFLKWKSMDLFVAQNNSWTIGNSLFSCKESRPTYLSSNILSGYHNALFRPPPVI